MNNFHLLVSLTIASIKMYFRNVAAVFFTLFIPIMLVVIFGLLSGGDGKGSVKVGLTNHSDTKLAKSFVQATEKVTLFKVTSMNETQARDQLGKGKIDLEVVIPKSFGETGSTGIAPTTIQT